MCFIIFLNKITELPNVAKVYMTINVLNNKDLIKISVYYNYICLILSY